MWRPMVVCLSVLARVYPVSHPIPAEIGSITPIDGWMVARMHGWQGVKKKRFWESLEILISHSRASSCTLLYMNISMVAAIFDHFVEVLCYLYLCNVFLEMLQCLKKVTLQLDLHFRNWTRSQQGKYDKYSRLEIKFVLVQGEKNWIFSSLCAGTGW